MVFDALGRVVSTSLFALVCTVGALTGCKKESAPPPTTPPITQVARRAKPPVAEPGTWYRARLAFDGIGELPFFLHTPPPGKNGRAYVINGDETAEFQAEWR